MASKNAKEINDLKALLDTKDENGNLTIWKFAQQTPATVTKQFKGKGVFTGTSISATYQAMKATELWGPYGHQWGLKYEIEYCMEASDKSQSFAHLRGVFYYPDSNPFSQKAERVEFQVDTDIPLWEYNRAGSYWTRTTDVSKKLVTDATTKALSRLGFSADVFLGMFDGPYSGREPEMVPAATREAEKARPGAQKRFAVAGKNSLTMMNGAKSGKTYDQALDTIGKAGFTLDDQDLKELKRIFTLGSDELEIEIADLQKALEDDKK